MVVPPGPEGATTTGTDGNAAADAFVQRPWFGGAMSASLPQHFLDASDVRPVPDHQEVWHDGSGGGTGASSAAVLVEIVEHDGARVSDTSAGAHFFADAAEGAGAEGGVEVLSLPSSPSCFSREVDPSLLPAPRMPGSLPTAVREGAFVVPGRGGNDHPPLLLAAAVAVFRLPRVDSDIVITSFEPCAAAGAIATTTTAGTVALEAAAAGAVAATRRRLARVVGTVQVNDWGLFGGEGGGEEGA